MNKEGESFPRIKNFLGINVTKVNNFNGSPSVSPKNSGLLPIKKSLFKIQESVKDGRFLCVRENLGKLTLEFKKDMYSNWLFRYDCIVPE